MFQGPNPPGPPSLIRSLRSQGRGRQTQWLAFNVALCSCEGTSFWLFSPFPVSAANVSGKGETDYSDGSLSESMNESRSVTSPCRSVRLSS